MYNLEDMKNNIIYSDSVYAPESIFSGWLVLSYTLLSSSLLFYHMSQVKTIHASKRLSAVVSVALVIISACYMMFALGPYSGRMNHVINICENDDHCDKEKLKRLIIVKYSYIMLGLSTSIIQLIIVYLILHRAFKSSSV